MEKVKEYSNGEVTVLWKPNLCIHSKVCVEGLPKVFNPQQRPWVNIYGANSEAMVEQVSKCPSGALSMKGEGKVDENRAETSEVQINIMPNGPLIVKGLIQIKKADGQVEIKKEGTAFCRCGASSNKPYCDGTHNSTGFLG